MNRQELISCILTKPGPRLVILNTVQSAAVIAHELRNADHEVLHLSTALAPIDRKTIITRIHRKLEFENTSDWTLVATSCVEAGVDFSFNTAFRESSTLTSLIQTGGRANRHGKDAECSIIDFRVRDPLLNKHPAFDVSRTVLDQMFEEGLLNQLSPAELASESVYRELGKTDVKSRAEKIRDLETKQEYRELARFCRIIDADTRLVVVTPSIVEKLENDEKVPSVELLRNSVQLWSNKIDKLELMPLKCHEELYTLGINAYDSDFLGYMAGLLPLVYQHEEELII
jgi:CRISPR-associated endonuclease/helicase Cas3